MVNVQIRLMTTGHLTADDLNFTAGKFNGTVEKAVKKFQGQSGLDATGKVDETTWRALGLWVASDGSLTISAPNSTIDSDIQWGARKAQDDLIESLVRTRRVPELRVTNGYLTQWNLENFTYANSYSKKLSCLEGEPVVAGTAAKGYDMLSSLISGYQETSSAISPINPVMLIAGTAYSAFWIYHGPGAQDAANAYYTSHGDKVAQAKAELNLINNSILRYVIEPEAAGNNYGTIVNVYNNDIAGKAHNTVRRYGDGSVQNLSVGDTAYVTYLENVMRLNFDTGSQQLMLNYILP